MIQRLSQVMSYFPGQYANAVDKLSLSQQGEIEELRLRNGFPPTILLGKEEELLHKDCVTGKILEEILLHATGQAIYSAKEMLKKGFLTVPGGHRLGICGTAVYKSDEIAFLKDVSSINLRIASQRLGFSIPTVQYLWTHPDSTLIVAPPGWGKTTLLRDLILQLSKRFRWRICVCDERMELAACLEGAPQFDLGPTTDVISGAFKSEGISMLLRTMNPQWIAVDEITSEEDVSAMCKASYCGVRFLATAHAANESELKERPVYRQLLDAGIFRTVIIIGRNRELEIRELKANV